jgi:hypothetical protein
MATMNILAGFDSARLMPNALVHSDAVAGFDIFLRSADDGAGERFTLHVRPSGKSEALTWTPVTRVDAIRVLAAIVAYSEREFGVNAEIDEFDRMVLANPDMADSQIGN